MNIFGLFIPLWVLLSVGFGILYIVFSCLSKAKVKKIKAKRDKNNVTDDI